MSDIFRDLTIKQNKTAMPIPPHYRKQIVREGHWRKEEHISDIMIRVIVGICDRATEYHRRAVNEAV